MLLLYHNANIRSRFSLFAERNALKLRITILHFRIGFTLQDRVPFVSKFLEALLVSPRSVLNYAFSLPHQKVLQSARHKCS